MHKLLKYLLAFFLSMVVLCVVIVALTMVLINSQPVKQYVADKISERIGREVTIAGPMKIDPSFQPQFVVHKIWLANASWANAPTMADIGRLVFRIDLPALIHGQIVFSQIDIDQPSVHLQRTADGKTNWAVFTQAKSKSGSGSTLPIVQSLTINQGQLTYKNPARFGSPLTVSLDQLKGRLDTPARTLQFDGRGQWAGRGFTVSAHSAPQADNKHNGSNKTIPLSGKLTLGDARAQIDGTIAAPVSLQGLDARLRIDVPQPQALAKLAGIDLRPWPELRFNAQVSRQKAVWKLADIKAQIDQSRVSGKLTYDASHKRPKITADLQSPTVDLASVKPAADKPAAQAQSGPLIPNIGFRAKSLTTIDVDIDLDIATLATASAKLKNVRMRARLKDGRLKLKPLRVEIGGGALVTRLDLKAADKPVHTALHISANQLNLQQVFTAIGIKKEGFGVINGQLDLSGMGKNLHEFMAGSKGHVAVIMQQGQIDRMLVELIGQSAQGIVGSLFGGNQKTVKLRCLISDWQVSDGRAKVQHLLADTRHLKIVGDGAINLDNQSIDLKLVPHGKDISLLSSQAPVDIRGSLSQPKVSVDKSAMLDSFATPVELGLTNNANCQQIAQAARNS